MGTGKTSIGKLLAVKLGCAFIDLDNKIETDAKMKIPDIFKNYGEAHFRELERQAVKDVSQRRGIVIATGGGTVKDAENVRLLKQNGIIICLTASVDEILNRTAQKGERPVLDDRHQTDGDRRMAIEKLINERREFYDQADYKVDTTDWSPMQIINDICYYLKDEV
ncbi:MAG: shikimate kinase [Selenomonadaceae bacterium]|nr:shikimate kinase [Selenomonadaceae bacterium]MBR1858129.1 shikimate kinase [Selenomonadaceae bacterium]